MPRVATPRQQPARGRVQTVVVKRALALAAAAATVGGGLATVAPAASPVTFRNAYVTFRYPASWHLRQWRPTGGALRYAVWLSNVRLRSPCRRTGASTTCSEPLRRLPPRTVYVSWTLSMTPGFTGRPVPLSIEHPGGCRRLGGGETISEGLAGGTFIEACVRGPGLAADEREVQAMLASARVLRP
jgi:hypothetical protein